MVIKIQVHVEICCHAHGSPKLYATDWADKHKEKSPAEFPRNVSTHIEHLRFMVMVYSQ